MCSGQKADARLAMALMSIQAIKGVEIGAGFAVAAAPGSRCMTKSFTMPLSISTSVAPMRRVA